MEFKYCDRCGNIIEQNANPQGNELLCEGCAGKGPKEDPGAPSGLQLLEEPPEITGSSVVRRSGSSSSPDLNLFSNDTLVARREPQGPSKLKLVDARDSEASKKPGSEVLAVTQPLQSPVAVAAGGDPDRWRVDCFNCQGSLSVRPVQKRSKLRCPRCKTAMVLDPSGSVTPVGGAPAAPAPAPAPPPAHALNMDDTISEPGAGLLSSRDGEPAPPNPGLFEPSLLPGTPEPAGAGVSAAGGLDLAAFGTDSFGDDTGSSTSTAIADNPFETPVPPTPFAAGGDGSLFDSAPHLEIPPTEDLTGALLAEAQESTFGQIPPPRIIDTRPAPTSTTASTLSALFWVTLALVPSVAGLMMVHTATGAFGDSLLTEMGDAVSQNTTRLLDWCAQLVGQ